MPSRNTQIVFGLMAIAWVVIIIRAYSNVKSADDFVVTVTQEEVQEFARAQLNAAQTRSFAEDIELCGIIFEESGGTLGATPLRNGDEASCGVRYFDEPGMRPVASFHTHSSYNEAYDSEVPSILDLQSDLASGMDGYVATPGGRFWHVDHRQPVATQVCGPACLNQDPNYKPCPGFAPDTRYTLPELTKRQTGGYKPC